MHTKSILSKKLLYIALLSNAYTFSSMTNAELVIGGETISDVDSSITSSYSSAYGNNGFQNSGSSNVSMFRSAKSAANRSDIGALYQYEQTMKGSLFEMYPEYWRLNQNISSLSPQTVQSFVQRYAGSVMAEKLVADYAETKARNGEYELVRQVANLVTNADKSESCALALGYLQGGNTRLVQEQKDKVWLTTLRQKELCTQLATQLNNHSGITNQDRHQRLIRMLRKGNTGDIIALSTKLGTSIQYSELSGIQINTNSFLNRFATESYSQKNQYLYLYAIGRLASKSYREAQVQLEYDIQQDNMRGTHLLSDETRHYAYRTIAVKRMNMNTDNGFNREAVTWFRNSLGEPFNFEEAEDYAQAAIRFSEWQDLVTAIGNMPKDIQTQNIWQYWLARAYEKSSSANERNTAERMYNRLSNYNDYYGFLSKDKIGRDISSNDLGSNDLPVINDNTRASVYENPHFARAFALYEGNADYIDSKREWNWAVRQAINNNQVSLVVAAARQAYNIGWYDRAVYAIDALDNVNMIALSHPMPYQENVMRYSRNVGIDPAWSYGIMRQESRFVTTARSGVGAGGLMQIMPGTARTIARNMGEYYNASNANTPNTNIRYGTWYLNNTLSKVGYQTVVATAGYNAGPLKAQRWLPNYQSMPADQYIESIAYPETRNYVKRVMENATIYGYRMGAPKRITDRMGTVSPAQ